VQIKVEENTSLMFSYLPSFAEYLLTYQLHEFSQEILRLSKKLDLPLLKGLENISNKKLENLYLERYTEFLKYISKNETQRYIEDVVNRYATDEVPAIKRDSILAEDINLIIHINKQGFLHFLPQYCKDAEQIIELVKEIDCYALHHQTAASSVYIDILKRKLGEHLHFIEMINNTSPGAVYVFDIINKKGIYSNDKAVSVFGYTQNELNELSLDTVYQLIHSDDVEVVQKHLDDITQAADHEIQSYRYRIRYKTGQYKWLRHYVSVFKRAPDGKVIEIIGIALDVDKEKRTAELLKLQEQQLLEAQEISHIGSFSWNFNHQNSSATPQLSKILEFGTDDPEGFFERVHPYDKKLVEEAIEESKKTGSFECEYRYQGNEQMKIIWAKGKVVYENNEAVAMKGTVMDISERHNLLQKLQESETLYKQAQALVHLGNWTLDLKSKLFVWSDEMYNIYEIEKNKKIWYEDWLSFIHPDDKEQVHNYLWKCISEKKPYEENYRIVINTPQPDGQEKIKTIQKKAELILDENGIPIKMTGTTQDVTQQKEYEHKLKQNQNFIQKITDATPSIIASYNVNTGQYVFISEGFQKLLGYPAEIAMERGVQFLMELIHPDDLDTLIKQNTKALEAANDVHNKDNNDVIEFVYRMKHKNGTYRWFHTYGTIFDRNNAGKVEHLLNISLDITEQIESTQKIIDQEHFIEHIAEASPTILYLFDVPLNSIVYINHEIYYVSGYTTEEITEAGSIITTMLYHPDDYPLLPERKESNKKFQHQNSMMQYECRMKSKDGEWKWLLIREVIFKSDEEGKPLQILGAALDISKRKEMEKSILQNAYQLEQSNLSLEEFAYVASHDLKEPLRKISTFGDRLVATQLERLTDDGKIYLKKIVDASQRMQTMINDLLSVSMISGNKAFQTYSLQVILEEVKQALEYKIEQQNAIIEGQDLPEATIIPSQFRQLFQNILSNSLKFVKEDVQTVIKISYTYLPPEDVQDFQLQKANSYLKIVFEDNGIGFEDEYAGKIFQIFHRLHGRSEYEGTGIGLAICKKIIEHHGGIIYAAGKQNVGATMTLILPN